MKKLGIMVLAVVLAAMMAAPVSAMETQFGGYFRMRTFMAQNFTGEDETELRDVSAVDVRTRLFFTTILHENLKFYNAFEYDTTMGSNRDKGSGTGSSAGGWGDIGADGANVEIKNSYIDFNVGPVNVKFGAQGMELARGFLFSDDFSGAMITFKGDNFQIPFAIVKAYEGGIGRDADDFDFNYYYLGPVFNAGNFTINPFGMLATSDNASGWGAANYNTARDEAPAPALVVLEDTSIWYAGLNLDAKFDKLSLWGTGIYMGGEADILNTNQSVDFSAWLAAAGAKFGANWGEIRGQAFYATGHDPEDGYDEVNRFVVPQGQSYYWAEIMGYGILGDNSTWSNSYAEGSAWCNDQISNIMAANLGVTFKPLSKLSIALDVWYAALAEETRTTIKGEKTDELGTEVDLVITYNVMPNLTLNVVGAYLFAGDAVTRDVENDANPYEIGTRLTLSF